MHHYFVRIVIRKLINSFSTVARLFYVQYNKYITKSNNQYMKYDLINLQDNPLQAEPMTREQYLNALSKFNHPRHKEAMAIRNKKYFAPETLMEKRQSEDLDRHITSMHLAQD